MMHHMGLLAIFLLIQVSLAAGETPASVPATEEQVATPADTDPVQERAVRQGAGETGQCICMRPAGQSVFSAQGGCVSQPGNPCNGGCIMQQSTPGSGSMAPALKVEALAAPPAQGPWPNNNGRGWTTDRLHNLRCVGHEVPDELFESTHDEATSVVSRCGQFGSSVTGCSG